MVILSSYTSGWKTRKGHPPRRADVSTYWLLMALRHAPEEEEEDIAPFISCTAFVYYLASCIQCIAS